MGREDSSIKNFSYKKKKEVNRRIRLGLVVPLVRDMNDIEPSCFHQPMDQEGTLLRFQVVVIIQYRYDSI